MAIHYNHIDVGLNSSLWLLDVDVRVEELDDVVTELLIGLVPILGSLSLTHLPSKTVHVFNNTRGRKECVPLRYSRLRR
jgi:hypothetical protein